MMFYLLGCYTCPVGSTCPSDTPPGEGFQVTPSHHGCFKSRLAVHDLDDLGYPPDLGNHIIGTALFFTYPSNKHGLLFCAFC